MTSDTILSYAKTVTDWASSLPETLVGVVIGSMFTLAGVVLTNRTNLKNLRIQLQHDREEKAKERTLDLRRDIYLGAAEAISAAINTVGKFSDLSLDHSQLMAHYQEKNSEIAKVHVIAGEATALHLMTFLRELGTVFVRLSIERSQLLELRSSMHILEEQMRKNAANRDHYLELMKHSNVEGIMDDRRMKVLESGFNFEQKQADEAAVSHDSILKELRPKHLAFAERCLEEERRLSAMLLPLIVNVRDELEQPINADAYANVLNSGPAVSKQDLARLFGIEEPTHEI